MGRLLPFLQNLGNALHVDDALAVHLDDRVIRNRGRQLCAPVALEGAVLCFAMGGQRLDQLADQAGRVRLQVAVCLRRMPCSAMNARLSQTNTREPKPTEIGKLLSWLLRKPTVSS